MSDNVKASVSVGILFNLLAMFCFAIMDTSAKLLVTAAVPALQVAFLRYFVHFIWALILYLPKNGVAVFKSNAPKMQTIRGLCLLAGTVFNFIALQYLPLTVTIAIFFASPFVVCLLSIPILGEKVGIKRFTAVLVGFMGVLIIVSPWDEQFDMHVLLSLCALMGASGYFVMTRKIAGVDKNAVSQTYTSGLAMMALAPFVITHWTWDLSPGGWVLALLLGSLGMLGHSVLTYAHRFAEASVLAPTVYSQIIYITILSWWIFDSTPSGNTVVGTIIIVASGIYIWWRETRLNAEIPAANTL